MLRILAACFAAALTAAAAAPAAEESHAVAPGVTVLGAPVGGLTAQPARGAINRMFAQPITIAFVGHTITVTPASLGAKAKVGAAVRSALSATPKSRIGLPITYSTTALARLADRLASTYDHAPTNATVTGANHAGPIFSGGSYGLAVQKTKLETAIAHELTTGTRETLILPTTAVAPTKSATNFGMVIVVNRAKNTLRLYDSQRLVRKFSVATGQAIYPTPRGIFRIVDKQRDPWWYPPTKDAWARGLKPVPPGPSNPLGTRWMGLSTPGVGIHGTDEPTSIGYSASHGCVRMHVPDAEWLFSHVSTGTPVVIL